MMKSLKESLLDSKTQTMESLFDRDLVEKDIPGHQLKDLVFFDGQWVYRLRKGLSRVIIPIKDYDKDNALDMIDWKKVKQDLKKWGGDKIDLGLYAYANADALIMRNVDTNKKTENFARLIMSIPYIEEVKFGEFNSRFKDEFLKKLDSYILPNWKRDFCFDLMTSRSGLVFSLRYISWRNQELLRFEFLKNSD